MYLNYSPQPSPTNKRANRSNSSSQSDQVIEVDSIESYGYPAVYSPFSHTQTPVPSSPLEPPASSPALSSSGSIPFSPFDSNASSICSSPVSTPVQSLSEDYEQTLSLSKTQPSAFSLSPLSSGGFIYNFPTTSASNTTGNVPPQCFPPSTPTFTMTSPNTMLKMAPVSPAIASRQEKLEKYKQKRSKRMWNRPIDQGRRERAQSRCRDEFGHFLTSDKSPTSTPTSPSGTSTPSPSLDPASTCVILSNLNQVKTQLEQTKRESFELKETLNLVLAELMLMKKRAEEASANQQIMQKELQEQQMVNKALQEENKLLWSTVPSNEIFSTLLGTNNTDYIEAFREKIDLSQIGLNWTDSRHLEAARAEENQWGKRFDEMTFIAGAIPGSHNTITTEQQQSL